MLTKSIDPQTKKPLNDDPKAPENLKLKNNEDQVKTGKINLYKRPKINFVQKKLQSKGKSIKFGEFYFYLFKRFNN